MIVKGTEQYWRSRTDYIKDRAEMVSPLHIWGERRDRAEFEMRVAAAKRFGELYGEVDGTVRAG
jgi:hypothetical protein